MIRAYSQRLLPPFSGVVQIAESETIRAQSFDGVNWELHFLPADAKTSSQLDRPRGYGLDRSYYRVANVQNGELNTYIFPAFLNHDEVARSIAEVHEYLGQHGAPFEPADCFEYWLLDARDESPLALILSCCDESLLAGLPAQAAWTALPHSKLQVENTSGEQARNDPPVNHRLQDLINRRAGGRPKAAWFDRRNSNSTNFPGLLVREDWIDKSDSDLCQRYLERLAPRLLTLHGLTQDERERMEVAGKQLAIEMDECFPLFPEVNDEGRMAAIRVEAQFLRNAPAPKRKTVKDDSTTVTPMSKDMRIIEN